MDDFQQELRTIKLRLDKIESQLTFLSRRLGFTTQNVPSVEASPTVMELVQKGDKAAAIKAFMQETGAGLKDAKNFIESLGM